jgi:hypothetical protein
MILVEALANTLPTKVVFLLLEPEALADFRMSKNSARKSSHFRITHILGFLEPKALPSRF